MRTAACLVVASIVLPLQAETNLERGKRVVQEALQALGGDRFLSLQSRYAEGRAYSFYREQVSGLSVAHIHTRYLANVKDTANTLAIEERQFYGKKQEASVLFQQKEGYDITFRGARPLKGDQFARYKESTLRGVLYILRIRFREPGMIFESRGADVLLNRPVEIVDITDAQDRTTTVYFDQTNKWPLKQVFIRRDPVTKERDEEDTLFSKYRDIGGGIMWPLDIHRERNGDKVYEIFCDRAEANKGNEDKFFQLPGAIKLLKPE